MVLSCKGNMPHACHIHMLHWKRFLFSWTVAMCQFKWSFLQSLHYKWCFWKASFLQQLMLHVCSSPRLVQQLYLNDFLPPWTDAKWLFKLPFCVCKTIATIITLGILLSLMDCCYVSIQVSISCITNIEFQRFLSFMNCVLTEQYSFNFSR